MLSKQSLAWSQSSANSRLTTTTMCYSRSVIFVIPLMTSLAIFFSIVFLISQGNCPDGHFPCGDPGKCIRQGHICDGFSDCPGSEDEDPLHCLLDEVPDGCYCTEFTAVICSGLSLKHVPLDISESATRLILYKNDVTLKGNEFKKYSLHFLHLGDNGISFLPKNVFLGQSHLHKLFLYGNSLLEIPDDIFKGLDSLAWLFLNNNKINFINFESWDLKSLTWLDLSKNQLTLKNTNFPLLPSLTLLYLDWNFIDKVSKYTFEKLPGLKDLSLGWNQITKIDLQAFDGNHNLQELNLRNNKLKFLHENIFASLKNLHKNLNGNSFLFLDQKSFSHLKALKSLDLQDIDINNISPEMFSQLNNLDFVYFKRFRYCTYVSHAPKCLPLSDGTSSTTDLLTSQLLITLWLIALFTLSTNGLVLYHRLTSSTFSSPLNVLITSLASSDFLMGIYLLIIGSQDLRFKGNYMINAREWMSSWFCTVSGILATMSSEVSVLMLLLISAERYLMIATPLSEQKSLKPHVAKLSLIVIWIFGLIISILPVVYWRGAMSFYGTNGFCFPLLIDDPFLIGWQYSAGIFLGINGLGIVGITLLYFGVFLSIYKTRHATTLKFRDSEFAMRFFVIILTNFCCWVPIIILKTLALMGVTFSGELYGWLTVFVLPINSTINPILYTFSIPTHRFSNKPTDCVEQGNVLKLKRRFSKALNLNSRQAADYEPPKTSDEQF